MAFHELYWTCLRSFRMASLFFVSVLAGRFLAGNSGNDIFADLERELHQSMVPARPYGFGQHFFH